ncbi:paraneoplastic antigen-like protein 5 [Babylonia areolata]|uniref:paraneoplastic antigen-like protein 5 n=1 Tax=Babylonia areolata TaxID=304850 RepID=UPI003FD4B1AF
MAESKYSDVSAMADTSTPATVVNVTTGKPWLVKFTGEDIESYPVWRHQLSSLIANRYSEKEVSNAIRSSLHGQAGRVLIRMGTDASVSDIIKMDSIYGTVDMESDLLATFYGARQGPGESVADWSCRLEEILDQVKKQGPLPSSPNEMLRTMLWTGLRCELKDISMYIYDRIKDFDELRTALRRLEKHPQFNVPKKPVVSKMNQSSEETSDRSSVSSQRRIQCYRCGQLDHVAAGCRVRLDHLKRDFHRKPMTRGDS